MDNVIGKTEMEGLREDLCAGTTEEKHRETLDVMRSCLINIASSSGGEW